jgi:hypothetical protein
MMETISETPRIFRLHNFLTDEVHIECCTIIVSVPATTTATAKATAKEKAKSTAQ